MLDSTYNHSLVEANKVDKWHKLGVNKASRPHLEPFCIVIPPPNITAKLHLGHAMNLTLQDIIIRYKRMQGFDALWLPGMDHAGIATEAKVDERLRNNNLNRYTIGREEFLNHAWNWKVEHEDMIHAQWNMLGLSLDYDYERFTLDEELNRNVNFVFTKMYEEGLIYRGEQIINWDPQAQTALSNIEVIHQDILGFEHYFKYMCVENPGEYLEVMTTRPETMFGDGALAVHPDDKRYQHLIGKHYVIPNTTTQIALIADEYVSIDKGTGVVKITMAHDPNDFEVAKRHGLTPRIIMNPDATMCDNEYVPACFQGLDRFEARKLQIEMARTNELLIKIEEITHSVGHSERTGVIVEPYLSKQWFVKMEELAKTAIENQDSDNKVEFFPNRYEKTFITWMDNVYDWCISRQLWWGHRIPAWYRNDEVYVGIDKPDGEGWVQDEDVLDTWFSSALWPFSTLGFMDDAPAYQRFFPTNTLVTGFDIIFFWVSRMIFQSLKFTNKIPFKDAVITGLIRDEQGRKMSKSTGNGIDPADIIEKYGTDSLRNYLTTSVTQGSDLSFNFEKLEANWNYINKIWNASRFVLMQSEDKRLEINLELLTLSDQWILNKLSDVIVEVQRNMENYEFVVVGTVLSDFVWNDYCSWYLEISKINMASDDEHLKTNTIAVLQYVLKDILKMLHPFMPFVTDEIYSQLSDESIVTAQYPKPLELVASDVNVLDTMIEIITKIRTLRLDFKIAGSMEIPLFITGEQSTLDIMAINLDILKRFCKTSLISFESSSSNDVITHVINNVTLEIESSLFIDKEAEKLRLQEEIKVLENEITRADKMLSNPGFLAKAPESKVAEETAKLQQYQEQLNILIQLFKEF